MYTLRKTGGRYTYRGENNMETLLLAILVLILLKQNAVMTFKIGYYEELLRQKNK